MSFLIIFTLALVGAKLHSRFAGNFFERLKALSTLNLNFFFFSWTSCIGTRPGAVFSFLCLWGLFDLEQRAANLASYFIGSLARRFWRFWDLKLSGYNGTLFGDNIVNAFLDCLLNLLLMAAPVGGWPIGNCLVLSEDGHMCLKYGKRHPEIKQDDVWGAIKFCPRIPMSFESEVPWGSRGQCGGPSRRPWST